MPLKLINQSLTKINSKMLVAIIYYHPPTHTRSVLSKIINIILSLLLFPSFESFSHQCCLRASHWSFSDCKSLQVSRTILGILDYLNNAVVWMVSARRLIPKSFSPCTNSLVTVPKAPIIIGIIVTFMLHSLFVFFQFSCKVELFILLFVFFQFYSVLSGNSNVHIFLSSLFFLFFFFSFFVDYYRFWSYLPTPPLGQDMTQGQFF